jgi:hypothetical protein
VIKPKEGLHNSIKIRHLAPRTSIYSREVWFRSVSGVACCDSGVKGGIGAIHRMKQLAILNIVGFFLVIINILLYGTKFFLRSKGYPVTWIYGYGKDFENLKIAAKSVDDVQARATAIRLLIALRVSIFALLAITVSVLVEVIFGW